MGKASKKKARRRPAGNPPGPVPSVQQVRAAEAKVIQPGLSGESGGFTRMDADPDLREVAERLAEVAPGLARKLGQGLSKDELTQLAPEIARAMHAAGAGPGAYTFTDQGPAEAGAGSVPAKIILGGTRDDGEAGLPPGFQGGDIIATEQPLGYVEAGVDLPDGARIEPGAKVYRVASGDVPAAVAAAREAGYEPVIDIGKPAPAGQSQTAIAGPGTYDPHAAPEQALEAIGHHRHGPEIVVTDDLDALDTSQVGMVIEDLDPDNPDDAGRVLIGSPDQVRRYHDRTRTLNERMTARLGQTGRRAVTTEAAADLIRLRAGWDADTVLGHHAWLTRHYRDPSPELADYLAFIMRDQVGESSLSAGIFWPVDLSHGPADQPEGRQLAQVIARGLGEAETFQVTRGMCEDMRQAWETSEVRTDPLPLSESELPVPAGFCWLDRPWMIREDEGHWLPVRAVSWERTVAMAASERRGGASVPMDAVRMCIWLAIEDTVAFGHWEDPARAAKTATWLGQVVLHRVVLMPFDFGSHVNRGHTALTGMLGLVHILWMYLGMELPRSRPVQAAAPAVRRRVQKSLKHDAVHIITLRKYDYIGDRPARFPKIVNWSCRWWVEKFWRHINSYDDEDADGRRRRHKPVPALRGGTVPDDDHDICGVCWANGQTVRITEVHGFFKGPTDKPLRTPAKDRTLSKLSRLSPAVDENVDNEEQETTCKPCT